MSLLPGTAASFTKAAEARDGRGLGSEAAGRGWMGHGGGKGDRLVPGQDDGLTATSRQTQNGAVFGAGARP